ncbi:hypothetical protein [Legionella parisiensis]|uniref:Uncharacterized protein n=1 Tax=Legionella parisiensis TaxID=45071 RepID=A0A1E5JVC1_9GAMM|nr:hypothetical protein [Legionella parisiensis]KTD41110.1 hypothetical protein Lpar_2427 [Legionella parisiensis]OEH48323.1 hypothetical protein lpari_00579 [Legionella parisiensis]STX76592.1 Uncharacterised protein [Legionella parisiensis]
MLSQIIDYIKYSIKRFLRYLLIGTLAGCVTFLPIFLTVTLPFLIQMSCVLVLHDLIIAKRTGKFLPSFTPMYAYMLSWTFTIAIGLFLLSLIYSAITGAI